MLLLAAAAAAIATHLQEVRAIADVARSARWEFLAAAAGTEALFIIDLTLLYVTTFRASAVRARFGRFLLLTQAAYFVNLVSKTGGLGGIVPFLQEARRNGDPAPRAAAAYMMVYALGYVAYVFVLAVALLLLYLRGSLIPAETAAAIVLMVIIIAVVLVASAALRSEASLERLIRAAAAPLNRVARLVRRAPVVPSESAHDAAEQIFETVSEMRRQPAHFVLPVCFAIGVELIAACILYLTAHAVHAGIGFETALIAYAIGLLFSMISITPSGFGFVEAALSVLLISFGVSRENAIAAAIGYRLFEFWIPVLIGFVSFSALRGKVTAVPQGVSGAS